MGKNFEDLVEEMLSDGRLTEEEVGLIDVVNV